MVNPFLKQAKQAAPMSTEINDKPRKNYSPDQKFKIVKEQMTTKMSVTEICKKYDLSPTNFYKWQNQFLKSALEGFKTTQAGPTKSELRKIADQEEKINKKGRKAFFVDNDSFCM